MLVPVSMVFFHLLLLRAGIGDLITMRIPNWLILTLLLGYAVLAPLAGFTSVDMAISLACALVVFCVGLGVFACGWIGGGDVKLMAVAALWLGLPQLPAFVLFTTVFGAVLTLGLLVYRAGVLPYALIGRVGWVQCWHVDEKRVP